MKPRVLYLTAEKWNATNSIRARALTDGEIRRRIVMRARPKPPHASLAPLENCNRPTRCSARAIIRKKICDGRAAAASLLHERISEKKKEKKRRAQKWESRRARLLHPGPRRARIIGFVAPLLRITRARDVCNCRFERRASACADDRRERKKMGFARSEFLVSALMARRKKWEKADICISSREKIDAIRAEAHKLPAWGVFLFYNLISAPGCQSCARSTRRVVVITRGATSVATFWGTGCMYTRLPGKICISYLQLTWECPGVYIRIQGAKLNLQVEQCYASGASWSRQWKWEFGLLGYN